MERYELPEGWEWKRLGDKQYFDLIMGQSPPSSFYNLRGVGLPFFQGKAEFGTLHPVARKFCSVPSRLAEKDDILISVRAPVGPTNLADQKCCIGRGLAAIRCNDKALPLYLLLALRNIENDIAASVQDQGGGFTAIKREQLENIEIPIPPQPEQRRIVKRIEELTRRVEEAQKLIREAMQDISSLNPSLLDHLFQMAEARNWRKVELGEISTIIMGQSPKGSSYNLNGRGAPLLNGPTEFGTEHPTPVQWTTEPTRLCEEGDILFCVRGSTTGRMNWADQQYCLGRGLAAIRPHQDKCPPGFVYAFVQTQAAAILHQGEGGVFPNFNRDQLTSMEIPLPPIDEQRHVVEYLNKRQTKARELEQLQAETEAELAAFTPALLAKAFRGEL